jgi:ubiquinone/menaquinone biosynthesis C-methylase UbiE
MKINIGAGDVKIDGFVNCDHDSISNPDFIFDLEKDTFPFEDNSVETVVAHHIFEHLGEGYFHCLQELYRVCKHGALIDIRVPHHRHDSFASDPTHRRPITIVGLKLFSKKFNKHCREKGYASSRLGDFYDVDFEILDYKYIPDEHCRLKYSNFTLEQLEDYAHEHNNMISEVHIKLIVIKE